MFVLIGYVVILACVFGGFIVAGGNIMVIVKAAAVETLIIGGGAAGAFIAANSMKTIKASIGGTLGLLKGPKFGKADYIELLKLLYELLMKIRKEGLMAVESHVENPEASAIFQKYPKVMADHHLLDAPAEVPLGDRLRRLVAEQLGLVREGRQREQGAAL